MTRDPKPQMDSAAPDSALELSIVIPVLDEEENVPRLLEEIEQTLPIGYRLAFATFQPDRVERSIDDFTGNLYGRRLHVELVAGDDIFERDAALLELAKAIVKLFIL